ncbi:MAG TPA: hypothetical protein VI359_02630 [Nitrospiraceae bacterium]
MNYRAYVTLRVPSLVLIVGVITIVLASTSSLAEQPTEASERESLRGVTGVEVRVDPLDVEVEQLGLQTSTLQKEIKQRLQKAGVNVLTERERLKTPTAAMLVIRVDTLHDRIGRYFYSIDLLLTQRVHLEGQASAELSAVTWMKLGSIGTVADDNIKHIETQILQKADQFIKEYLAMNPDRKVKS